MMLGILSMVTFNLADTFFVGKLGTLELAALSFTFPVVLIVNSMAMGLGIGTSSVISRAIGEGDAHKVRRLTTDSLVLSAMIVAVCVVAGSLTIDPLFRAMGATPDVLPLIRRYMRIWYIGSVFVVVPMVGNNAIRAGGDMLTPGLIMTGSAALNLILDPIFIFGAGPVPRLEIAGAALATVIGRATSLCVALAVLYFRDRMLTSIRVPLAKLADSWRQILYIGLPSAGTRVIVPLGAGVLTRMVARYGTEAVAGYGVATRIEFFTMTTVMALASVLGPFVGQNWGAGVYKRARRSVLLSQRFSFIWGFCMFGLMTILARPAVSVFNSHPDVVSFAAGYLHLVPLGYGLYGVLVLSASVLNVLKKPFHAAALSLIQMFGLCIPFALIGSRFFGAQGLFGAVTLSYVASGIVAFLVTGKMMKSTGQAIVQGVPTEGGTPWNK